MELSTICFSKRIMVFNFIENITSKLLNKIYQNLKFAVLAPVSMSHCYMRLLILRHECKSVIYSSLTCFTKRNEFVIIGRTVGEHFHYRAIISTLLLKLRGTTQLSEDSSYV